MSESVKEGVESLPLIEKIINIKSTLMVFVVLFTVDLCLLFSTGKNLITYPWDRMQQNLNHGQIAVLFAASLACYVVIVPLINLFFLYLASVVEDYFGRPFHQLLFRKADKDAALRRLNDQENIATGSLRLWAARNNDQFAYELTKNNAAAYERQRRQNARIHQSSSALLLLLAVEYATSDGVWVQAGRWIATHFSGDVREVLLTVFILSIFVPLVSWWLTRLPTEDHSRVYYPKAAKELYEKRKNQY